MKKNKEKVAHTIIETIRDAILSGNLKPGDKVGKEKELIEQYGVSKATMREALSSLESMGLLESRKGSNGGAFVAEVNMSTTISSILNFCHLSNVSIKDITMLRYFIEPDVVQIAAWQRTEEDIRNLHNLVETQSTAYDEVESGIGFHCYLSRISRNSILILLLDFLESMLRSIKISLNLDADFYRMVREHHTMLLECIKEQDAHAARVMVIQDILETGRYLARKSNSEFFDPSELNKAITFEDRLLSATYAQKVVKNDHILSNAPAVISRRVGLSNCKLVSFNPAQTEEVIIRSATENDGKDSSLGMFTLNMGSRVDKRTNL